MPGGRRPGSARSWVCASALPPPPPPAAPGAPDTAPFFPCLSVFVHKVGMRLSAPRGYPEGGVLAWKGLTESLALRRCFARESNGHRCMRDLRLLPSECSVFVARAVSCNCWLVEESEVHCPKRCQSPLFQQEG